MANDPTLATLTVIVARLLADAGVAAIVADRVFDAMPPQETPYPFIAVGSFTMVDFGDKDYPGNDSTFVVHCWSREASKGAMQIAAAVYASLHEQDVWFPGFQTILLRHVSTVHVPDPDGKTHHAAATYRIITTQTS